MQTPNPNDGTDPNKSTYSIYVFAPESHTLITGSMLINKIFQSYELRKYTLIYIFYGGMGYFIGF